MGKINLSHLFTALHLRPLYQAYKSFSHWLDPCIQDLILQDHGFITGHPLQEPQTSVLLRETV